MNLYIRLVNGQPIDHPIVEENLIDAFPEIDINNLPDDIVRFERVEKPHPGLYEVYVGVSYEWDNGIVKDVHTIRPMTPEEILEKQNRARIEWIERGMYPSWIFDEEICRYVPPIPYPPEDGNQYRWDEDTRSWINMTIFGQINTALG